MTQSIDRARSTVGPCSGGSDIAHDDNANAGLLPSSNVVGACKQADAGSIPAVSIVAWYDRAFSLAVWALAVLVPWCVVSQVARWWVR